MELENMGSTEARDWMYGIGAMEITANMEHNWQQKWGTGGPLVC